MSPIHLLQCLGHHGFVFRVQLVVHREDRAKIQNATLWRQDEQLQEYETRILIANHQVAGGHKCLTSWTDVIWKIQSL